MKTARHIVLTPERVRDIERLLETRVPLEGARPAEVVRRYVEEQESFLRSGLVSAGSAKPRPRIYSR